MSEVKAQIHTNPFKDDQELDDHPLTKPLAIPNELKALETQLEQMQKAVKQLKELQQMVAKNLLQTPDHLKEVFVQLEHMKETLYIPMLELKDGIVFQMSKNFNLRAFHDDGRTCKYKLYIRCPLTDPRIQGQQIGTKGVLVWAFKDLLQLEFESYSHSTNFVNWC